MLFKQSTQFLLFVNLEVYPKKKEMRDTKIMSKMKIKRPKLYMLLYRIMETSQTKQENPENSFRFPHGHPPPHMKEF